MHSRKGQREEIRTIRPRSISLNLSDADVYRLASEAAKGGITVELLLQNFIGDLVSGTYSNGSDERALARKWYDRCWFGGYSDADSFLQYLARMDLLDYALELWDEREELLRGLEKESESLKAELAARERKLREELLRLSEPYGGSKAWDEVLSWRNHVKMLLGEER